jgi:CMP-2-keto-3-deoxyoctulosonic acid synthetase
MDFNFNNTTVIILVAMVVLIGVFIVLSIVAKRAKIGEIYKQLGNNEAETAAIETQAAVVSNVVEEKIVEKNNHNETEAVAPGRAALSQPEEKAVMPLQGEKPEIIAAAMGALIFTLEEGANKQFTIASVTKSEEYSVRQNSWAYAGRSRLMQVRQDFALNKGRKG